MTRVSENSTITAINNSFNKAKSKLEDLQKQGTVLKKITSPSDDPVASIEALRISSSTLTNNQYIKNADYAIMSLNHIESSLEQISDTLQRVREIALAQSSDLYGHHIRKNIASEIIQIKKNLFAIANKRIGQKYLFGGYKTLSPPFNEEGMYVGDDGKIQIEVGKDFFVPINLSGREIFSSHTLPKNIFTNRTDVFGKLDSFIAALENNDALTIRGLIENFDEDISRMITLRTQVGSIIHSIGNSKASLDLENLSNAERKSFLVDADLAELFTDLAKQQSILKASYKASQTMLNKNLLDFL